MKNWKWVKSIRRWQQKRQPWWELNHQRVYDFLRKHPSQSGRAIYRACGGDKNRVNAVLYAGVDEGSLVVVAGTSGAKLYTIARSHEGAEPIPAVKPQTEPAVPVSIHRQAVAKPAVEPMKGCCGLPSVDVEPLPPAVELPPMQKPTPTFMESLGVLTQPAPPPPETVIQMVQRLGRAYADELRAAEKLKADADNAERYDRAAQLPTTPRTSPPRDQRVRPANWSMPPNPKSCQPIEPAPMLTTDLGDGLPDMRPIVKPPTVMPKVNDLRIYDADGKPLPCRSIEDIQALLLVETPAETAARISNDMSRFRAARRGDINPQIAIRGTAQPPKTTW
jgi:hypothetical protein